MLKALRYVDAAGTSLEEIKDNARKTSLYQEGDIKLVWVNEGDLYEHSTFFKDPRACRIGLDTSPEICSAGTCISCIVKRAYEQGVSHARNAVETHMDWNPSTVREDLLLNIDMQCSGFDYQGKSVSKEHTTWLEEILLAVDDEDEERLAWAIQMARNSLVTEKASD